MTLSLTPHASFPGQRPVLVVVADGVGVAPAGPMNAVTEAATPTLDQLCESRLYTTLLAHGLAVGLPSDNDMAIARSATMHLVPAEYSPKAPRSSTRPSTLVRSLSLMSGVRSLLAAMPPRCTCSACTQTEISTRTLTICTP